MSIPLTDDYEELIFNTYYPMDKPAYSDAVVKCMSLSAGRKWKQVLAILDKLDILVFIIPLNLDTVNNIWWSDYCYDYIKYHRLNTDDKPHIALQIKCQDSQYDKDYHIHINHDGIVGDKKKQILDTLGTLSFFEWDGTHESEMRIYLEL